MSNIKRGDMRVRGFEDAEMDFQLIRQMGASCSQAASPGECLTLASKIEEGNPESWVEHFADLARRQAKDAEERMLKGHLISARKQFYKACDSFRAAEYYSPCEDEEHRALGCESRRCFEQAMALSEIRFEKISIDYKRIRLPLYFIAPDQTAMKRKTVMIVSGFDGTMEEEFFMRGLDALERGYNVVLFAGPGQMDMFRDFPSTSFEPDFENPVKAVVDYLYQRDDVDIERLALMGISFGGYFATKAASRDERIKALIANSPILDLHAYMSAFTGMDPAVDLPDEEDFTIDDLPQIPDAAMPKQLKAQSGQLMRRFGGLSFKKTFVFLKQFVVGDAIASLSCPCLALIGEGEGGEPKRQFDLFRSQTGADHYLFTALEGADAHCQMGNVGYANAVAYDWLDEQFDIAE